MIGTTLAHYRITAALGAGGPAFAPSADCQRFLVIPRKETSAGTPLNLMVGWPQVLEENK